MSVLFLSGHCFISIYFIAGFLWGNVLRVGTSERKKEFKGSAIPTCATFFRLCLEVHHFRVFVIACDVKMRVFSVRLRHMQGLGI